MFCLQDDPPNPELYPGESSLVSDLSLHDATSTTTGDTMSEHGVSSSEFTGTTINLQDLEWHKHKTQGVFSKIVVFFSGIF